MTTKEIWLKVFEEELSKLPKADRQKAIEFYREMIEDKIEGGMTEEEVVKSLGNPFDVAEKILKENGIKCKTVDAKEKEYVLVEKVKTKKEMPIWLAFILGIVVVPVAISLFAGWFSVLISFWAVFVAMVASSVGCVLAIFASLIMGFTGYVGSGFAIFGFCVASTGVVMILAVVFWYLAKGMTKATGWLLNKMARRGEKNEK